MARLTVLCLLFSACVMVRGDLGLNLTIPGLVSGVSGALSQGMINLIKANGTIRMEAEMDSSGALVSLIKVVNDVTSPLNKLLGATLAGSSKKDNSQELFAALSTHVVNTKAAIDSAVKSSDELQSTVKPSQYNDVRGNVTLIESNIPKLQEAFTVLSTTAAVVESSKDPVTSDNVTNFFTKSILDDLINPLLNITQGINGLATTVTSIVKDKMASMNAIASVNGTINNGLRSLATTTSNFNRSVNDAGSFVSNNGNGLYGSINQMYSPYMNRPQNFNGGDVTRVSNYLAELKTKVEQFSSDMSNTFTYLRDNVTVLLNSQVDRISKILLDTAVYMTNTGYSSSSENGEPCASKYTKELTQNPLLVSRLSGCLQPEVNGFNGIYQLFRVLMDQTRTLGGSVSAQVLGRQCTQGTTDCVATYFGYLEDLSQQVNEKLKINVQIVHRETLTMQNRIGACTMAVTADIADNARMMQGKFENCLVTGTRNIFKVGK
ncbi:AAEL003358-PA [Aedes aegypti]|uniref:AAEL003358-PA n=2 Tax=Aedes aegypti TaxID=7159 RepID=A0A1S4F4F4_AEDAE|nr:uncharacterized protein LOC5577913 [Aedes aegypti]EAT45381.2 AAEL003358-PA [Aedes aegypti]